MIGLYDLGKDESLSGLSMKTAFTPLQCPFARLTLYSLQRCGVIISTASQRSAGFISPGFAHFMNL